MQGDREVTVAVVSYLQPMFLGLVVAGVDCWVASVVLMMVLWYEVTYGPVVFAHLNLAPRAEVPRL